MKNEEIISDIKVVGVEKPQKGKFQQHFEYVIRVTYSDGHEHFIFRRYSMLFDFHAVLKELVKTKFDNVVVLPELPVARFQHAGRKFLRLGMSKELKQMTDFCQKITKLPDCITDKDIILRFFGQLGTDVAHAEIYKEQSQKRELQKELTEIPRSPSTEGPAGAGDPLSQDYENQYRSVAEFEASGTGELSVTYDEIVTVIEKNSSGWWLVSNTKGVTGFTPATFLEPLEEKTNQGQDWVEVMEQNNKYTARTDYEALCPDEISFKCGEEFEVLAKSNFGWWRVRRRNEVGLCPASNLTIKKESCDPNFDEDPMYEFQRSILSCTKKLSNRGAPPRRNSKEQSREQDHYYGHLEQPEENTEKKEISVKYTQVIPKHLRPTETNNDKDHINYVNVPVIKDGIPHYHHSQGEEAEAVNVYVVRKDYESNGLSLKAGELVHMIAVMPDGCKWRVARMKPPYNDGLIPADYLCPELPNQAATEPEIEDECIQLHVGSTKDREPVKVLSKFTQPPTTKKPKPKPRTMAPNSPAASRSGISVVAIVDYNPLQTELLAFSKGDIGRLIKKVEGGWWFIELKGVEGWVPNIYWLEQKDGMERKLPTNIPLPKVYGESQWYRGKLSRQQCEDLFGKNGKHLDFVVRESIQRVGSYVISIQFNDKVHHFPIEKSPSGRFVVGKLSFDQLSEIVSHYSIHPLFYTDLHQPVSIGKPLSRI